MKPGSVIVDLAAEHGRQHAADQAGRSDRGRMASPSWAIPICPARLAVDASSLYARNLFNFVSLIVDKKTGALALDWNDEIVKGAGLTRDGADRASAR